jgi:hypothetical protein
VATTDQKSTLTRNWIVIGAIALLAVFLAGFIPQFRTASGLKDELALRDRRIAELQHQATLSKARDLAGLLFLELSRKNYGVAEQHATAFFNHARTMTNDAAFAPLKNSLDEILGQRDAIVSSIAKSDPAVESKVRDTLLRVQALRLP